MNTIDKDKPSSYPETDGGLVSKVGQSYRTGGKFIETDLEFPGGIKYRGETYSKLKVKTEYLWTCTIPVITYIYAFNTSEEWEKIEEKYGGDNQQALQFHTSRLEDLIHIYKHQDKDKPEKKAAVVVA